MKLAPLPPSPPAILVRSASRWLLALSVTLLCASHPRLSLAQSVAEPSTSVREVMVPSVGASVSIPSDWHVMSPEELARAAAVWSNVTIKDLPPDMAEGISKKSAELSTATIITKYHYTSLQANPFVSILPLPPLPPKLISAPSEVRSTLLCRAASELILPGLRPAFSEMTVIEPPAPLPRGRGAWMTVRGKMVPSMAAIQGYSGELVMRIYMMIAGDKFIMVQVAYPADGSESGSVATLWRIVDSLKF
jgi:hypothetical protein